MFIKNAWYVACMPDDFQDKPLGRKVCGESMVFYRGAEGQAVALEDFCRHRGARVVAGQKGHCRGSIVCPSHGWVYNLDGSLRGAARPSSFAEMNRGWAAMGEHLQAIEEISRRPADAGR